MPKLRAAAIAFATSLFISMFVLRGCSAGNVGVTGTAGEGVSSASALPLGLPSLVFMTNLGTGGRTKGSLGGNGTPLESYFMLSPLSSLRNFFVD